jgi:hypothetical protein
MIEIKRVITIPKTSFFPVLVSFGDDYPGSSLILLYRGKIMMKNKNIFIFPIELFLQNPGEFLK